jgi:prolipoprotein diacylglyceryltransferase
VPDSNSVEVQVESGAKVGRLMYCPLCFFMEFFRGDEVYLTKNALTVPQVMAVLVFLAAGIGLWKLLRTASAHLRSELEYRCCSPSQITRF